MSYRELARVVPLSFLFLGLIARLPFAIMPIATLTLLYTATGSYTFAGAAAAAQSIATAAGGIGVGALADRLGPRRADRPAMVAAAIAVGVTQPAVGPLARVHWARLLRAGRRAGLLPTAAPGPCRSRSAGHFGGDRSPNPSSPNSRFTPQARRFRARPIPDDQGVADS